MNHSDTTKFINTYKKFYVKESSAQIILAEKDYSNCRIPKSVKPIEKDLEDHIISKINAGKYDAEAFAWKAGKAKWKDGKFEFEEALKKNLD